MTAERSEKCSSTYLLRSPGPLKNTILSGAFKILHLPDDSEGGRGSLSAWKVQPSPDISTCGLSYRDEKPSFHLQLTTGTSENPMAKRAHLLNPRPERIRIAARALSQFPLESTAIWGAGYMQKTWFQLDEREASG